MFKGNAFKASGGFGSVLAEAVGNPVTSINESSSKSSKVGKISFAVRQGALPDGVTFDKFNELSKHVSNYFYSGANVLFHKGSGNKYNLDIKFGAHFYGSENPAKKDATKAIEDPAIKELVRWLEAAGGSVSSTGVGKFSHSDGGKKFVAMISMTITV